MKNLIPGLLILVVFSLSCKKNDTTPQNNNNNNNTVSDCFIKTMQSAGVTAVFYYDKNDHITSGGISFMGQSDSLIFVYDGNGNVVKQVSLSAPSDTDYFEVYDLNAAGKILKVHQFNSGGSKGFSESEYDVWTYGSNNRPSKIEAFTGSGTSFNLSTTSNYTYDAVGNVLTISVMDIKNQLQSTETFQYDTKRPAKHFNANISDPANDNKNNVTDDLTKDASGKETGHTTSIYEYNSNGYPVQETDTDNTGSKTIYTYTYNCR